MTEETHNAAMSGPIGIVMAIGVSAVLGWFLILGLLFSIQDLANTVSSPTGEPVAQIFLDTVGEKGAIVLMVSHTCVPLYSKTGIYARTLGHCYRLDVLVWHLLDHVEQPDDVRLRARRRDPRAHVLPQSRRQAQVTHPYRYAVPVSFSLSTSARLT